MKRILYALRMAWQCRSLLRAFQQDPNLQIDTLLALSPLQMKQQGIKAVALDFDGVLAAHGETKPRADSIEFISSLVRIFGQHRIFIITNKPFAERRAYFEQQFRGAVIFIQSPRKKPYPDGLLQILQLTKVQPRELMVVDDRLLTGILAAVIVGAMGRYVIQPYRDVRKRPFQELYISCLRYFERGLIPLFPS